jgi:hypothetical protein
VVGRHRLAILIGAFAGLMPADHVSDAAYRGIANGMSGKRIAGTLAQCDPFGIPSTSHWTGAAIIVPGSLTKSCIVTRLRISTRPMPSCLAG